VPWALAAAAVGGAVPLLPEAEDAWWWVHFRRDWGQSKLPPGSMCAGTVGMVASRSVVVRCFSGELQLAYRLAVEALIATVELQAQLFYNFAGRPHKHALP